MTRAEEITRMIVRRFRKPIWGKFLEGIKTYEMIQKGDRIAVCISGGKDSMLMAMCMKQLQKYSLVPFKAEYLVMDPGYAPANRQRIIDNAELLDIPIRIFEARIFDAVEVIGKNPCYMCARMRRGYLYKYAMELGCNKIALGHHFDDVIETILMGMLYGSQMQTMMPKLHSENFPPMQLIRPMYMVREDDIIRWRDVNDLHFLNCACSVTQSIDVNGDGGSKRQEIKQLLRQLRTTDPKIDMHIFRSVENVNLRTLISYHDGAEYHHFLDDYNEGKSIKDGKKSDKT
ncbi:MAG: tRNA 2-thiocytidine biosynthesis protein TtcA [Ruminiclostridium sp.]|nr:tRNA 2-thiocytidine biosynthesis protein TtcA [Ruminiclostridium sp.]